jgi:type IV pilus assembly protein PilP
MKTVWCIPLVLLSGCAQDEFSDLRAFMAQTGAGSQQALEPLPPVKPAAVFDYLPGETPDPFKPRSLKASKGGGAFQPDLTRPKDPLEQFPMDDLLMIGTITKDGQISALVKVKSRGTLHRIKKGEHMGQNFGLVIGINESSMEIRETVQDGVGDWTETKATLALQEQLQ